MKKLAIRLHYTLSPFSHEFIKKNKERFKSIPAVIIHGRYDTCTPLSNAYKLHKNWPEAKFIIIPNGGHRHTDTYTYPTVIERTEKFASI